MKIKENFSKFLNKMKDSYKNNKKLFLVSVIIIFIFIFVGCYTLFFSSKKASKKKLKTSSISIDSYTETLENKLSNMLLSVDEIKTVSVLVMVKSSPIINYLTENETNETTNSSDSSTSSSSSKVVFEKNSGTSSPIIISTIMPEVTGVLIVTNKINATTRIAIINAISMVLNVDASRICILQER